MIQKNLIVFIFLCLCTSLAYGDKREIDKAPVDKVHVDKAYEVQAGDVVRVSVWGEPGLQIEALVRPDGRFSMPLAGEMVAKGKTIEIIRQEIITRLQDLIPDIDVMVSVDQLLGNKIYVVGKVNRPGEFSPNRNVDVMQALTMAAGATKFAELDEIKILRRENNSQIAIPFNYTEVEKGENLAQNIILRSGDIVIVP